MSDSKIPEGFTSEEFEAAKAAKLERFRKGRNRKVLSEYIRIGESDLYDYEPVRRAVLKEIAFMQVNDEDTKVPLDSPFKGRYEGWCYASQKRLAARVGTTEDYVRKCVSLMEKDGMIETRLWKDPRGYPHQEYHVLEEVVTAHQRPEDYMEYERKTPRRGGNTKPNKGSFSMGNKIRATGHDSRSHRTPQPIATGHDSRMPPDSTAVKPPDLAAVSHTAVESDKAVIVQGDKNQGGSFSVRSCSASDKASVAAGAAKREDSGGVPSPNLNNLKPSNGMDKNRNGVGVGVVVKERREMLNKDTYPLLYAQWQREGGRLPKCKRCKEVLHFNEPAHVCEGFVPKYAEMDMDARQAASEAAREALLEGRNDLDFMDADEV